MKPLKPYLSKSDQIPANLRAALPALKTNGQLKYKSGGYKLLYETKDVRVLPELLQIYSNTQAMIGDEEPSIFSGGHYNRDKIKLQVLIETIVDAHVSKLDLENPWCSKCFAAATRLEHRMPKLSAPLEWVFCPNCLDNQHLRSISQMVGLLGLPQVSYEKKLYASLWDDVERSVLHPERAFDVLEIHPSLGDQLDWALTAVVTALQNTSRGVPPIHLNTDEPLTENTSRLIEPYLK